MLSPHGRIDISDLLIVVWALSSSSIFSGIKISVMVSCAFVSWDFMCACVWNDKIKFSRNCVDFYTFNVLPPAYRFLQIVHSWFLTPLCDRMWPVRWPEDANPRLHILHMCGFKPVCVRWCITAVSLRAKVLSHMLLNLYKKKTKVSYE